MFNRISSLSSIALLAFGLAAQAADVHGVIVKVDTDRKEVSVKCRDKGFRGATVDFRINDSTAIQLGKQSVGLTDLSPGSRVRIVYELDGGRHLALSITAHGLLTAPAAPAPAPAAPLAPAMDTGLTGTLRRIALTDREIVLVGSAAKGSPETETTMLVPADAKITRDQKPIRFEDLKEGETAVVAPEKKEGKLVARSIQVGAAAPPSARPERENRIAKVRQILKMIDLALQGLDRN